MQQHIKKHGNSFTEIYAALGCSKQNISYWNIHSYSTQSKSSIYNVIYKAEELFQLSPKQAEALANSSGLSLYHEKIDLIPYLGYHASLKVLSERALISDRMLRYYKNITPAKQPLIAIAVSLGMPAEEIDALLHKYGYCLSKSIAGDVVVRWHTHSCGSSSRSKADLLLEINTILERMGLPLLMTRQK